MAQTKQNMTAYYNELDPYAAQWLRNLIQAGHIAHGIVDDRSIEDVTPGDLRGFTQCHFFAGIGVWSYALRRAGWPDDRPVWTGSCPCQPFSAAGKGVGFADERHLWPAFFRLIEKRRPSVVLGEQVASKDAGLWIDLVQTDVEGLGYAFGAVPFPAASVGAPHIRDRLYWVADATDKRLHGWRAGKTSDGRDAAWFQPERLCDGGWMANDVMQQRPNGQRGIGDVDDASGRHQGSAEVAGLRSDLRPGPTNGFWRDADWLLCRDGKWRPVEPGYEQMADGSARNLGRVRTSAIEEIEGEVNAWSIRHQADAAESLRRVWQELSAQSLCKREVGRFSGVQSPAVLLAFLRQLTEQGWRFADALACARTQASEIVVRVLRFDSEAARTPLRRELGEQRSGQPTDALRELSSVVAHHAAECWGDACREKAGAASFPLAHGAPARVGRLRAYGNAINAEAARVFIESVMEAA